jgi:hypothetical protein
VMGGNGLCDVEQRQVGLDSGMSGAVHVRPPAIPPSKGHEYEVSGQSSHAYPGPLSRGGQGRPRLERVRQLLYQILRPDVVRLGRARLGLNGGHRPGSTGNRSLEA